MPLGYETDIDFIGVSSGDSGFLCWAYVLFTWACNEREIAGPVLKRKAGERKEGWEEGRRGEEVRGGGTRRDVIARLELHSYQMG